MAYRIGDAERTEERQREQASLQVEAAAFGQAVGSGIGYPSPRQARRGLACLILVIFPLIGTGGGCAVGARVGEGGGWQALERALLGGFVGLVVAASAAVLLSRRIRRVSSAR